MVIAQKTKIERYAFAGMVAVLAALSPGLLRSLGIGRPTTASVSSPASLPGAQGSSLEAGLPPSVQTGSAQPPEGAGGSQVVLNMGGIVEYTAETMRDPMISLLPKKAEDAPSLAASTETVAPPAEPPRPTVEGMIWGSLRPQAFVDGQLRDLGDQVNGATITGIDARGVTFSFRDSTFLVSPPHPTSSSSLEVTPTEVTPTYSAEWGVSNRPPPVPSPDDIGGKP